MLIRKGFVLFFVLSVLIGCSDKKSATDDASIDDGGTDASSVDGSDDGDITDDASTSCVDQPTETFAGRISASDTHSCAVTSDGFVQCWGEGGSGRLGDDSNTDSATPVTVKDAEGTGSLSGAIFVATGLQHSCAILSDTTVQCWGEGGSGQLGNDSYDSSLIPTAVLDVEGTSALSGATSLALGKEHSCALINDGTVLCWGSNGNGQLGQGDSGESLIATGVKKSMDGALLTNATAIVAKNEYTCALIDDGTVQCWGDDAFFPVTIKASNGTDDLTGVTAIAGGLNHICALIDDGTVQCWGEGSDGQLGDGSGSDSIYPVTVLSANETDDLTGVVTIAAGDAYTCALIDDSSVQCWGSNNRGQLNQSIVDVGSSNVAIPTTEIDGTITRAIAITAGSNHVCAWLNDESIQCWGDNLNQQLGQNWALYKSAPTNVEAWDTTNTDAVATKVVSGAKHACALLDDSTVQCWGDNEYGQLGDGTVIAHSTPSAVMDSAGTTVLTGVSDIAAGHYHTCAVVNNDSFTGVQCWGNNDGSQLGDETLVHRSLPVSVADTEAVTQVTAGFDHTCALLDDNTAKCWGAGNNGQLGNNGTSSSTTPVDVLNEAGVGALGDIQQITAGYQYTCARVSRESDTVIDLCWGKNSAGQLGDESITQRNLPVAVSDGVSVSYGITANYQHTCAWSDDAFAKCWGNNSDAQLGDHMFTDSSSSTPLFVVTIVDESDSAISDVQEMTVGGSHSCARFSDNTVQCWGANASGQIGNETLTESEALPITVSGISTASSISAGENHTCALLTDGSIQCWGGNSHGQLGTPGGAYSILLVPVLTLSCE